jgi:hypothetical protein
MTYQAYINWGDHSLYHGPNYNQERAYEVSFDRPYADYGGLGDFPVTGYNLVRWFEREGFDKSYATDVDTDLRGSLLSRHRLVVFADHDEYWSSQMRANATAARDHGTSPAFFSANNIYWHVRLSPSALGANHIIICYRSTELDPLASIDPANATVRWRDPPNNQPENALLGGMYQTIAQRLAPMVLGDSATALLAGTGLHPGSQLPGLIGGEVDSIWHNGAGPQHVTALATSFLRCQQGYCGPNGVGVSQATVYTTSSGARVFDAGTFYWSWGLDDGIGAPYMSPHTYSNAGF